MEGVLKDLLVSITKQNPGNLNFARTFENLKNLDIIDPKMVHKLRDYLSQYSENCGRLKSELAAKD
jgi:hypothetical protein